jgi:hypothetical protein
MMSSHYKTQESDAYDRPHHSVISYQAPFNIKLNQVRKKSKSRKNKDIDFRMSKKPEKMLEKYGISSPSFVKVGSV